VFFTLIPYKIVESALHHRKLNSFRWEKVVNNPGIWTVVPKSSTPVYFGKEDVFAGFEWEFKFWYDKVTGQTNQIGPAGTSTRPLHKSDIKSSDIEVVADSKVKDEKTGKEKEPFIQTDKPFIQRKAVTSKNLSVKAVISSHKLLPPPPPKKAEEVVAVKPSAFALQKRAELEAKRRENSPHSKPKGIVLEEREGGLGYGLTRPALDRLFASAGLFSNISPAVYDLFRDIISSFTEIVSDSIVTANSKKRTLVNATDIILSAIRYGVMPELDNDNDLKALVEDQMKAFENEVNKLKKKEKEG